MFPSGTPVPAEAPGIRGVIHLVEKGSCGSSCPSVSPRGRKAGGKTHDELITLVVGIWLQ